MTEETKVPAPEATGEEKVNEAQVIERPVSPRQRALEEIVESTQGRHDADNKAYKENFQEVDEDGKPVVAAPPPLEAETPPPDEAGSEETTPPSSSSESPESPPATPEGGTSFDPAKEYELVVDGHKIMVKGDKILEMGKRTIQKEAAADLRLRLASRILEEAQAKASSMGGGQSQGEERPAPKPASVEEKLDEAALAEALQFGTREQAAEAVRKLSARQGAQVTPEQVMTFVRQNMRREVASELEFNKAAEFVESEYKDLMSNDYLKRMFFMEEDRLRRGGDNRPYKELYNAIGEDLRAAFKLEKPASATTATVTMAQRKEEKAKSTPPVPKTAAARLDAPAAPKQPSQLEILNQMRAARRQPLLT